MSTYTSVDWYSFSVDVGNWEHLKQMSPDALVAHALRQQLKQEAARAVERLFYDAQLGRGRVPYAACQLDPGTGAKLFFDLEQPVWLIELCGQACWELRDREALTPLLKETHTRCTRIDVATDYEGEGVTVFDLCADAWYAHDLTHVFFSSATGETRYIGSMKSDRFCRIYSYNEPHPRANVPRVELVYRGEYAPLVAEKIAHGLIHEVVAGAYERLGMPERFIPENVAHAEPKRRRRGAREVAGRLRWVYTAVIPALQRLILEGHLTVDELLIPLGCVPARDVVYSGSDEKH